MKKIILLLAAFAAIQGINAGKPSGNSSKKVKKKSEYKKDIVKPKMISNKRIQCNNPFYADVSDLGKIQDQATLVINCGKTLERLNVAEEKPSFKVPISKFCIKAVQKLFDAGKITLQDAKKLETELLLQGPNRGAVCLGEACKPLKTKKELRNESGILEGLLLESTLDHIEDPFEQEMQSL